MPKRYVPKRGDIVFTNFDPSAGHEQAMRRPALVLSPQVFNKKMALSLVAPITSKVKGHGFEVLLDETTTQGAILCHQIKMMDFDKRGVKFIEEASVSIMQEVLAKVRLLVS
ncbi:MAG: type II toxin-antitoxin system PemK/MazF family toxin [Pseudomonadales bacterium]|nr:type II toxin-antitoxin system PemK/MazF family toxin [Pseudomonadales bacterium]